MEAFVPPKADITSQFNELLRQKNAAPVAAKASLDAIDGFLKEAYRIVRLIGHCDSCTQFMLVGH